MNVKNISLVLFIALSSVILFGSILNSPKNSFSANNWAQTKNNEWNIKRSQFVIHDNNIPELNPYDFLIQELEKKASVQDLDDIRSFYSNYIDYTKIIISEHTVERDFIEPYLEILKKELTDYADLLGEDERTHILDINDALYDGVKSLNSGDLVSLTYSLEDIDSHLKKESKTHARFASQKS